MTLIWTLILWVSFFPVICALLAHFWGFGWPIGVLTGVLWGPLGLLALWTANQPAWTDCEDCGRVLAPTEMTCPRCGAEYFDDEVAA